MNKVLQVKIVSPIKTIYEGTAFAVSSINTQGKFDILPEHASFITLVEKNSITVLKENKEKFIVEVNQAIIHNFKNQVSIYIDPHSVFKKSMQI